ncbi:MAG TPA: oxidoreductase [Granulicella sp.]
MKKWTIADIPSQTGKLAVVTGANSGIGWNTALELARAGAEVVIAARSPEKGSDAVERIKNQLPKASVRYDVLDLADLRSVRAFAERINEAPKLDLLVNNAGVMAVPTRKLTADGFEMQFGTNYLGPFALTLLLVPALQRAKEPRVTTVSSGAANMGARRIILDDLQWEKRPYGPFNVYCQSKLADLYLMLELGRRTQGAGWNLISNAAHPGYARTNLQTSGRGIEKRNRFELLFERLTSQDSAAGAAPTLLAATSKETASGTYYAPSGLFQMVGDPVEVKVPKIAQDIEVSKRLWALSEELIGVRWPVEVPQRAAFLRG